MKTAAIFTIALITIFPIFTFAHSGSSTSPMESMMRQMMGDNALNTMEQMEDQMMGNQRHERMEELMNKMFVGNLTQNEQREIIQMMQDSKMSPAAMTMMMRMMMPQMMQNAGFRPILLWSSWVTNILVWVALALAIAALIKWLTKK